MTDTAGRPDKPRRKRRELPDTLGGPLAVRDKVMALAGLDAPEQARLLVASVRAAEAALEAERTEHVVVPGAKGEGATVESYREPDHGVRLRGADLLMSLVNAYPSRSAQGSSTSAPGQVVNVNVTLKDMSPGQSALPGQNALPLTQGADGTYVAEGRAR